MSLRGIILRLAPAEMAARMEAESREWMMRCPNCGAERSIWELGGIRYKARGRPRRRTTCWQCGRRGWFEVYRDRGSATP
jgi:transposase-like protein